LLTVTLVAILLATIPMIGGWGTANWMIPWAAAAVERGAVPDPTLKAWVLSARSLTGIIGSLIGGWVAAHLGRRLTYFLASLASLLCAQCTFWFVYPTDPSFLWWVSALGFASGIYFGWLPLCLPEFFPTRWRSTGAGVGFNFGRIITGGLMLATGVLTAIFAGDYAVIGRFTSLFFVFGMIGIWLAPDTGKRELVD
jgi:MFS family permease